jgi:hypothetical protein
MRSPGAIKILVALLAVAAVVIASGCGSSSDETTSAGETTAPSPPASTSTTPEQEAPIGARATSCESGGGGELRVTGVPCGFGRLLVSGWYKNDACSSPAGASRTSCKLGPFTCLGAATDRGLAVTCASKTASVAFVGKKPG